MNTKCKNCDKEFINNKNGTRKFCSEACQKAYSRRTTPTPTQTETTPTKEELPISDKTTTPPENVRNMSKDELYARIQVYEHDTWKDSPEFLELERRLNTYKLERLIEEGYWIPSRINPTI